MIKTTLYLPDELKHALTRTAAASGRSEADLIREAIARLIGPADRPRPRGGLYASGDPSLSQRVADAPMRFGAR